MHAQPSTRSRKPAPLIVTCMSAGMLAMYCNALIDTNGEQCTSAEDCANAAPFTECSPQKVCVRPAAAPGSDGAAGGAQTAADAASSSTGGGLVQHGTGGATTRGSGGNTASEPVDSGKASQAGASQAGGGGLNGGGLGLGGAGASPTAGGGMGASYADAGPGAEAAAGSPANGRGGGSAVAAGGAGPTEDASTGSTGRGGTTVTQSDGSIAGPPASATHVLSFDTETGWDVTDWSGYRPQGERPPFDLAFGWKSTSIGASGVLTMWPEPDEADPNPRPVVTAIKNLDGSPAGKVPVGAKVTCMVYIPSSCKFGTDGFIHMFIDGGEYAPDKFDWSGGDPCTARDRWDTCSVEGTKVNMGAKIGFEFWYSPDGDCMTQQVLVDWCAF